MIPRNKNFIVCVDYILFSFFEGPLNEGWSMPKFNLSSLKETNFTNMKVPIMAFEIKNHLKHKTVIVEFNSFL